MNKENILTGLGFGINILVLVFLFHTFFLNPSTLFLHNLETQLAHTPTVPLQIINVSTTTEKNITATSSSIKNKTISTKLMQKVNPVKPQIDIFPVTQTITPSSPIPTPEPPPDFVAINDTARKSVVNIICETKTNSLSPITASGVIIDSRGTILTNAHVGQYFLLRNFQVKNFIECMIRTGSPAYPRYHVELVYISPTWVQNNKTLLKQTDPKGTGENDFAFLRITDSIDGTPLPIFSHLPLKIGEDIDVGQGVDLVAYPAGFLGGISILQDLNLTSTLTTVKDVFTFNTNTIDLISVPGTILSQKGASGGASVDTNGSLIGIITTSTDAPTTGERDLRAITIPYINRTIKSETGMDLRAFLSQDLVTYAHNFQLNSAPTLSKLIEDELLK